jgi:hypothetical protein
MPVVNVPLRELEIDAPERRLTDWDACTSSPASNRASPLGTGVVVADEDEELVFDEIAPLVVRKPAKT